MRLTIFLACVMNFITYERAYCLYPVETISKSISLLLADEYEEVKGALLKYERRGFTFYNVVKESEAEFTYKEVRWVEDRWSWVHQLENIGLTGISVDTTRLTTWSILTIPREKHRIHVQTIYTEDVDPVKTILVANSQLKNTITTSCLSLIVHGSILPSNVEMRERWIFIHDYYNKY